MLLKYCSKLNLLALSVTGILASTQGVIMAFIVGTLTNFGTSRSLNNLQLFLTQAIVLLLIVFVAQLLFNRLKANTIKSINVLLRRKIFLGMIECSTDNESNKLSFLTNDLKMIEENEINAEISIGMSAYILLISICYALYLNWLITLIFLFGSLIPMLISGLFQKKIEFCSKEWSSTNQSYVTQMANFLNGADTIRLYNGQKSASEKSISTIIPLEESLSRLNVSKWNANSITGFIANIFTFLFPFLIGIILVINGKTSLGSLFAIVQLANSFINPIMIILNERNNLSSAQPIVVKVNKYFNLSNRDKNNAIHFNDLTFNNISLSINNKLLLSNLNIDIHKGDKIAIIGPSGYGKSTLAEFMMYGKNGSANIQLNGKTVSAGSFLNLFAYSKQKPVIFADNLLFNLTLGKNIAKKEIFQVCEALHIDKLITEKSLEYNLGDNADNLSGGQLARVSLARAILANRDILILDEINASLDKESDQYVHDYLLNSNKTVIEIIHHYDESQLAKYNHVIDLKTLIK